MLKTNINKKRKEMEKEERKGEDTTFFVLIFVALVLFAFVEFNGKNVKAFNLNDTIISADTLDTHSIKELIEVGKYIIKKNF